MKAIAFIALLSVAAVGAADQSLTVYFANWAQYHAGVYKHTPSDLAPILSRLDRIIYSFIYFCPPAGATLPYWAKAPYGSCSDSTEYQLMSVEAKDSQFIPQIVGYKSQNPNLKVIASIGGWNFPSSYFSKMVASSDSRSKFIASVKAFVAKYNLDGVDIDWEFPCSPKRDDPVKITCSEFRHVTDDGGSCPDDTNNFPIFLQELREAMPSPFQISVASQAAPKNWEAMNIVKATPYVDMWHVMTYDYTVSDITSSSTTAPNSPLYNPPAPAAQWSVNFTVQGYIEAGVPKEKIALGIPYYGHTWYVPGLTGTAWQHFGLSATVQGECCGPFQQTYGAKAGKGCSLCGTMMYSEILAAGPSTYYDNTTQSMIGYFEKAGADGYTEAGTWVSYTDLTAVKAVVDYAKGVGIAGVFGFDTSMDTVSSSGQWTFDLTNRIADELGGHAGSNTCSPSASSGTCGSGVCTECCSSSITDQGACNACVSSKCGSGPSPTGTCSGKSSGQYCVSGSTSKFMWCPQGITQSCAPGTCCKSTGEGTISCGFC